jgi:hypothetical protein
MIESNSWDVFTTSKFLTYVLTVKRYFLYTFDRTGAWRVQPRFSSTREARLYSIRSTYSKECAPFLESRNRLLDHQMISETEPKSYPRWLIGPCIGGEPRTRQLELLRQYALCCYTCARATPACVRWGEVACPWGCFRDTLANFIAFYFSLELSNGYVQCYSERLDVRPSVVDLRGFFVAMKERESVSAVHFVPNQKVILDSSTQFCARTKLLTRVFCWFCRKTSKFSLLELLYLYFCNSMITKKSLR